MDLAWATARSASEAAAAGATVTFGPGVTTKLAITRVPSMA